MDKHQFEQHCCSYGATTFCVARHSRCMLRHSLSALTGIPIEKITLAQLNQHLRELLGVKP